MVKNKLTEQSKVLTWKAHDTHFIQNTVNSSSSRWEAGSKIFWELFNKKPIRGLQSLKKLYSIDNLDFYRYLQMCHMEQT